MPLMPLEPLIEALATVAHAWQDPDYEPRARAVEATLGVENRFTEEAIAFAVNQQMHLLEADALRRWVHGRRTAEPRTVGVLCAGNVPLVELQDLLAVLLTGHRYLGTLSSRSPYLIPAFVEEVRGHLPDLPVAFGTAEELFERSQAVIATGNNETIEWVTAQCDAHGIPAGRRLLRGSSFSVAVLDGRESADELEHLAEDALLHEGYGCRNVAVIWAPRGLTPDVFLQALADFRGVFPAHPGLSGSLKMQQAFLAAVGQGHAFGEGMEFLLSRGEPEVQSPGHLRWVEYDTLEEVDAWLGEHAGRVQLVVAHPSVAAELQHAPFSEPFGNAQRPGLTWCPDGIDPMDFLAGL